MVTSNWSTPTAPRMYSLPTQGPENLNRTFFCHLDQALLQLFHFQRVLQYHPAEMFRCKVGNPGEFQLFLGGEGIADLDCPMVMDANNISRIGLIHIRPLLGHEDGGVAEVDLFAQPVMQDLQSPG